MLHFLPALTSTRTQVLVPLWVDVIRVYVYLHVCIRVSVCVSMLVRACPRACVHTSTQYVYPRSRRHKTLVYCKHMLRTQDIT